MSKKTDLPNATVGLGYAAAGCAMSVSYIQLRQILEVQGGITGSDYVALILPVAILLGAAALWRMAGHIYGNYGGNAKSMGMAISFVLMGAVFTEGISIFTSAMSLTMGMNQKIQEDVGDSRIEQNRSSVSQAMKNITASMQTADPAEQGELSRQMEKLIAADAGMAKRTSDTSGSATQQTFDEFGQSFGVEGKTLKTAWAWLVAIAMSLIIMAVQVGNGSLASTGGKKLEGVNP